MLSATLLIVRTYTVFNQTFDEGAHVAAGMEWLDRGSYNYEPLHPPLARIAIASVPYLKGLRSHGSSSIWDEGNAILNSNGQYQKNLVLARIGVLPFFWVACWLVWSTVSKGQEQKTAAVAVWLLAFCPPVLGHAAVATTDVPLMAMFLWSVLRLRDLLQIPTVENALFTGLVFALTMLCKLTAIPFLGVVGLPLLIFALSGASNRLAICKALACAILFSSIVIWSTYRFSIGPIALPGHASAEIMRQHFGNSDFKSRAARIILSHVPAHEFFRGIGQAYVTGKSKRLAYLLGHVYNGGIWYFFPVALAVKTPIALLMLLIAGTVFAACGRTPLDQLPSLALLGFLGPLAFVMASDLNIGLRHVLVVYPFIVILASIAVARLWRMYGFRQALLVRGAIIILLGWECISCLLAAPDFIAYFNEISAPYASRILIDSDLDWGQDLARLSARVRQLHVDNVWLAYHGSADPKVQNLPVYQELPIHTPVKGWIAISEFQFNIFPERYAWLRPVQPKEEIGKSIRLYFIPTSEESPAAFCELCF